MMIHHKKLVLFCTRCPLLSVSHHSTACNGGLAFELILVADIYAIAYISNRGMDIFKASWTALYITVCQCLIAQVVA
jgi:hypothetical protein